MYLELKSKSVVTKKAHECEWCGLFILAKTTTHYRAYVLDGTFNHGWMHEECHAAMMRMDWGDNHEAEWTPGDFERGLTEEK